MGRGLIILLLASLAANVFLGGFVAGRYLGKPPHHGSPPLERMESLSPEARAAVRDVFQSRRDSFREHRLERRELQRALYDAMIAEPFDREKVEAAMAALRQARDNQHQSQNKVLLDALENLSAEDRKALADMQNERRQRRGRRGRPPGGFK